MRWPMRAGRTWPFFSPSLYAELDWQRFRPDLADGDLKQILGMIDDLLFVVAFAANETRRYSFYVEAEWYGAADPEKTGLARAASLDAEFPERVSAGPPM